MKTIATYNDSIDYNINVVIVKQNVSGGWFTALDCTEHISCYSELAKDVHNLLKTTLMLPRRRQWYDVIKQEKSQREVLKEVNANI